MESITTYFIVIILASILFSIYAKQFEKRKLYVIVKPLTMLLIITMPVLEMRAEYSSYAYLIVTGLIFSLLGDLYLLFPEKYFNNGLYSFLVAHLLYIIAFNQLVSEYCFGIASVIIVLLLIGIKVLSPKLGGMKYLVFLYMIVISAMLFFGVNVDRQSGVISYVSIGAILFTISDTILAFNKFNKKIKFAEPIILSTYFVAQLLFSLSI